MRVAAKAFHFEIAKPGVDRVAQRRRWLRRSLKAEHALVPRLDRRAGRLPCGLPSPALPPPGPMRRKSSRVTWCPCERGCAGPRGTGKPLQIAVDGVTGTTEATPGANFNRAIGGGDDLSHLITHRDFRANLSGFGLLVRLGHGDNDGVRAYDRTLSGHWPGPLSSCCAKGACGGRAPGT